MMSILRKITANTIKIPKSHLNPFNWNSHCNIQTPQLPRYFGAIAFNQPFTSEIKSLFLKPFLSTIIPSCSYRLRGKPKLRCKDCYKVMRDGRLYIDCRTHGRHKQTEMVKKPKNTWELAHATQGKIRPW